MLTGQRAFEGDDFSDTLAAVLRGDPDWDMLPAGLSPTLVVFLTRCLQKDSKQRLGDIHDMRLALEGVFNVPPVESAPPPDEPDALDQRTAVIATIGSKELERRVPVD